MAATTLGAPASAVRAVVRVEDATTIDARSTGRPYQLVVQSYGEATDRPVGAVQRAVTADDLRRGVEVDVVQLASRAGGSRVVAWLESGRADLEHDGLAARPGAGAVQGVARADEQAKVEITLRKPA